MKNMFKILVVLSLVLGMSCASLQNTNSNDQSDIITILLERADKSRDSIHIIDWIDNKSDFASNKILTIKNSIKDFNDFKSTLAEQGINYNHELSYFKKQLKKPAPIDKSKIKLGNIRFFPSNIDPEKLFLDENFEPVNYYYDLPKIVFTEDGTNAIVYQKNRESANHFTLFKKVGGTWKSTIDILDKPPSIE